jgi:hypothetical protein
MAKQRNLGSQQEQGIGDANVDLGAVVPGPNERQPQIMHVDAKHFTPGNVVAMGGIRKLREVVLAGNMESIDETVALVMRGYVRSELNTALESGGVNLDKSLGAVSRHLGQAMSQEAQWNQAIGSRRKNPYEWESMREMQGGVDEIRAQMKGLPPAEQRELVQTYLKGQMPEYETHLLVQLQQGADGKPQVLRAASVDIALDTQEKGVSNAVVGYWGLAEGPEEGKHMAEMLRAARGLQQKVSANYGVKAGMLITELDPKEEGNPGAVETIVAQAKKGEIPLTVIDPNHKTPERSILGVDGGVPMKIGVYNAEQAKVSGTDVKDTLTHFAEYNYGAEGRVMEAYEAGLKVQNSYALQ